MSTRIRWNKPCKRVPGKPYGKINNGKKAGCMSESICFAFSLYKKL